MTLSDRLISISNNLSREVDALRFTEPVDVVYNPLSYAFEPHADYLRRYGAEPKRILFLGMNPGPFGMAQTGVPFGEVDAVSRFLGVVGAVQQPTVLHPKRPIDGFACSRSEVSGKRLWGWVEERFRTPANFFKTAFVANYCPLVFMAGKNATNVVPEKLLAAEREPLLAACDGALLEVVDALQVEWVIGVGAFARARAEKAIGHRSVRFAQILHPSPASPLANRGWAQQVEAQLSAIGLDFWHE